LIGAAVGAGSGLLVRNLHNGYCQYRDPQDRPDIHPTLLGRRLAEGGRRKPVSKSILQPNGIILASA